LLINMSDAFIVAPGGFGTYDELFETLATRQLGTHNKPTVLFNVNGYYNIMNELLKNTAEQGFMISECLDLVETFEDVDKLLDYLENYNPEGKEFSVLRKLGK